MKPGMAHGRGRAIAVVMLAALLAAPVYLAVGVLAIPLGIAVRMLFASSPAIVYLYPFLYAGELRGGHAYHYLDTGTGLALSVLQWFLVAWAASRFLAGRRLRDMLGHACLLLLAVGLFSALIAALAGIDLLTEAPHT